MIEMCYCCYIIYYANTNVNIANNTIVMKAAVVLWRNIIYLLLFVLMLVLSNQRTPGVSNRIHWDQTSISPPLPSGRCCCRCATPSTHRALQSRRASGECRILVVCWILHYFLDWLGVIGSFSYSWVLSTPPAATHLLLVLVLWPCPARSHATTARRVLRHWICLVDACGGLCCVFLLPVYWQL